jgi:hypothetical protein
MLMSAGLSSNGQSMSAAGLVRMLSVVSSYELLFGDLPLQKELQTELMMMLELSLAWL